MSKLVVIPRFADTTQAVPSEWLNARKVRVWGIALDDGDFVPLGSSPSAATIKLGEATGLYEEETAQLTPADPDDVPARVKVRFVKWTINQASKGE